MNESDANTLFNLGYRTILHVAASGELMKSHAPVSDSALQNQLAEEIMMKEEDEAEDRSFETDMCDVDYIIGKDSTGECMKPFEAIYQQEMCLEAAKEANVTTPRKQFQIRNEWYDFHPKGCFKAHCDPSIDPKELCYFFNGVGDEPKCKDSG